MNKPDIIFFDYGQTLVGESPYDHKKGFEAVLKHAVSNPDGTDAGNIADLYLSLRKKIWDGNNANLEVHSHFLMRYITEYYNIGFDCDYDEIEQIFWDNAVEFRLQDGITELLDLLYEKNIRTAVISNIDYSENTLKRVIDRFLPRHHFEFIIASSEYIFRKPDKEIFELAIKKANLKNAENAWFIGNDEYYDAEGAAKNGFSAFWYTGSEFYTPKREPECEHTHIKHWNELIDTVKRF
ncbi:MAG: HAD family hydrolase [Oscillospiraceae bacterium]|nr:HAD family hydrolase [Oscillospiraceae bacterium]